MTAPVNHLRRIATEAASLAAVLSDQTLTEKARALEVRDTLAILIPQLQAAGLMEAYEREGGTFGI